MEVKIRKDLFEKMNMQMDQNDFTINSSRFYFSGSVTENTSRKYLFLGITFLNSEGKVKRCIELTPVKLNSSGYTPFCVGGYTPDEEFTFVEIFPR